MNPYKMATGPNSEKINALLRELNEAEYVLANTDGPTDYEQKEVSRIKTELKALTGKEEPELFSGCFTADMLVLTEEGPKPIPDIKVGDKVLSFDKAGNQVAADVLNTYELKNNHYFLINKKIKVTAMHRFFTNSGWKKAQDLEIGDRMQTDTGEFDKIFSIKLIPADLDVYNLTISKNHNFYISPDGKNGYLVHNTGAGGSK